MSSKDIGDEISKLILDLVWFQSVVAQHQVKAPIVHTLVSNKANELIVLQMDRKRIRRERCSILAKVERDINRVVTDNQIVRRGVLLNPCQARRLSNGGSVADGWPGKSDPHL